MSSLTRDLLRAERRARGQAPFHMRGPTGGGMYGGSSAPAFNGDFAAAFESFAGLTVRVYRRGDLGVTGTTGTGKTNWANQHGDGSTMSPGAANAANGIGSVGAGMGGKASVVTDGATQNGQYTIPTSFLPSVTNHHIYAVERILVTPAGVGYLHSANAQPTIDVTGGQISPHADMLSTNGGTAMTASPLFISQWYRLSYSMTGSTGTPNDRFKVGSVNAVNQNNGNFAPGTQWGWGAAYNGSAVVSTESVLKMHIEGPLVTYLTAEAFVDTLLGPFWVPGTIQI